MPDKRYTITIGRPCRRPCTVAVPGWKSGAAFEQRLTQEYAGELAANLAQCSDYVGDSGVGDLSLVMSIGEGGHVTRAYVRPNTRFATCVRALSLASHHREYPFGEFLFNIELKIKP